MNRSTGRRKRGKFRRFHLSLLHSHLPQSFATIEALRGPHVLAVSSRTDVRCSWGNDGGRGVGNFFFFRIFNYCFFPFHFKAVPHSSVTSQLEVSTNGCDCGDTVFKVARSSHVHGRVRTRTRRVHVCPGLLDDA